MLVAKVSSVWIFLAFLFVWTLQSSTAKAQDPTTSTQVWPEIDVYVHLKPRVRLFFLATVSKSVEDGEFFHGEAFESQFGAHIDFVPNDHVVLRSGYRLGKSIGGEDPFEEHRLISEQTFRKLLKGDLLLSDRNREDFRWINGDFSFRYRNRVTLEKELRLFKGRTVTPYVTGELFYDTRYDTWNRNRYGFGAQFSIKRREKLLKMLLPKHDLVLDVYYLRQNDSRASTAHVNAIGMAWSWYF